MKLAAALRTLFDSQWIGLDPDKGRVLDDTAVIARHRAYYHHRDWKRAPETETAPEWTEAKLPPLALRSKYPGWKPHVYCSLSVDDDERCPYLDSF